MPIAEPTLRVRAFAKVNRSLQVLGARPDGYHELRTVFQSLALHDTLVFTRTRGAFRITCSDPQCPADAENLVWRAADAAWKLAHRSGEPRHIHVHLRKRIPMAAGLGGGSADAAATLRACARLWRIPDAELRTAAAGLGADVPYFLLGGDALGLDRGDTLFALADRPREWMVLGFPPFGVSTRDAYGWLDRDRRGRRHGSLTSDHAAVSAPNDLEAPVVTRFPLIGELVAGLREAGAGHAAMSGSGSTVFGVFDAAPQAARAARRLSRTHAAVRWVVTRTVSRREYQRRLVPFA